MTNFSCQPLAGVTVVDFSYLVPGPLATRLLQDAGAKVIRVVRSDGDPMINIPPLVDNTNAEHCLLVADKDLLIADLNSPSDQQKVHQLVAKADVLVEGFRPGVMDKFGFGYEQLKANQPGLIYCSITGYGQTGPNSWKAGHDLNFQAEAGLLGLSPGSVNSPTVPAALVADIAGGSYPAVINILLALINRDKTGLGCHLDIAMADHARTFLIQAQAYEEITQRDPKPSAEMLTGGSPRYALYATKDDRFLAVGAVETKFWQAFCDTLGLPINSNKETIAAAVKQQDACYWEEQFAQVDACTNVVKTVSESKCSEQANARGIYERKIYAPQGTVMSALSTPVAEVFKKPTEHIATTQVASNLNQPN